MKYFSALILAFLLLPAACSVSEPEKEKNDPGVKNIIFLIGDGMGVSHLHAAMDASETPLNMESAEFAGLSKTGSLTHKITDSAAGGTAMATGNKTANGVIGQDTTGQAFISILEIAEQNGLSTGIVSTSAITHATPASFIAHEKSRNSYEAIAADFLDTEIEVFIGGGYDHFGKREDGRNLVEELSSKGYDVDTNMEEVMASEAEKIAGLLNPGHMPSWLEGRGDMLSMATSKALDVLSTNEKGFFLMVEASQIDWGGHANDIDYVVTETLDLDKAVGVVLDFAKQNPGTLVVVSADHETGGLTLPSGEDDYTVLGADFSTGGHSAVMVPILSWGAGAEEFSGILDNVDFFPRFMELYGFTK